MSKLTILYEERKEFPEWDNGYSFTPHYVRTIRWFKTPSGRIVKEKIYDYAEYEEGCLFWRRKHPAETFREGIPFENEIEAIKQFMSDHQIGLEEAANKLQVNL